MTKKAIDGPFIEMLEKLDSNLSVQEREILMRLIVHNLENYKKDQIDVIQIEGYKKSLDVSIETITVWAALEQCYLEMLLNEMDKFFKHFFITFMKTKYCTNRAMIQNNFDEKTFLSEKFIKISERMIDQASKTWYK